MGCAAAQLAWAHQLRRAQFPCSTCPQLVLRWSPAQPAQHAAPSQQARTYSPPPPTHRARRAHEQRRHRQHPRTSAIVHDCCALQHPPLLQRLQPAQAQPRCGVVARAKGKACKARRGRALSAGVGAGRGAAAAAATCVARPHHFRQCRPNRHQRLAHSSRSGPIGASPGSSRMLTAAGSGGWLHTGTIHSPCPTCAGW